MKEETTSQKKKTWVKKRHARTFAFLRAVLPPFLRLRYHYRAEPSGLKEGPYLILSNHQASMDPFFLSASFPFPVYFFASDDIFNLKLSPLIRFLVNPIPKSKSLSDLQAVKDMVRVLKEGGSVGIFPEGNRTIDGGPWGFSDSVAKLVKLSGVPVVLYNLRGGYGTDPRWGHNIRRGDFYRGGVREVIFPEEYKKMSNEALYERLREGLTVDDPGSGHRYKSGRRAEYIERALYLCPVCGGLSTLRSRKNRFVCQSCGREAEYTEDLRISPPFGDFDRIAPWYAWEREEIVQRVLEGQAVEDGDILFRESVKFQNKQKLPGDRVRMDRETLTVSGEGAESRYPLEKITALTMVGKKKFNFYYEGRTLQVKGSPRFCAIKYVHLFDGLRAAREREKEEV